ncbi:DUF4123 domain-containing protein [Paraburkholderia sp. Ac-20340]|nr:DUF4123 domain-containing protein [Paraburkholderia sp. Ac-20340]
MRNSLNWDASTIWCRDDRAKMRQRSGSDGYVSLWEQLSTSAYPDIAPYLIAIEPGMLDGTDIHHALLEQLWWDTASSPMLTWMASPFGLDALAQHFQRFCTFRNPASRFFFRSALSLSLLARQHTASWASRISRVTRF